MNERIKALMQRTFELKEIPDDISQKNCQNWDSLRHLNLIVELETEFDVSIEPEEIAEMKTLQDIVRILQSKL
ncbi:MAG: acyl carrier protein [Bacteroidetes bacterium]|nr:acyl carrier protein [Bacteroidota bacterium]